MESKKNREGRPVPDEEVEGIIEYHVMKNRKKRRNKMGRPKVFETPDDLLKWYMKYDQWRLDNPLEQSDWVGKDAKRITRHHVAPPTWQGFEAYLFRNGVCHDLDKYRRNVNDAYKDFSGIIRAIASDMFDTKFSGAAVGMYKEQIISKELHLAEQIEVKEFEKPVLEGGKELPED